MCRGPRSLTWPRRKLLLSLSDGGWVPPTGEPRDILILTARRCFTTCVLSLRNPVYFLVGLIPRRSWFVYGSFTWGRWGLLKRSTVCFSNTLHQTRLRRRYLLETLPQVHLHALIKVHGVVTRRSGVFPQLKLVKYRCNVSLHVSPRAPGMWYACALPQLMQGLLLDKNDVTSYVFMEAI